jgi:hypothetical protein
MLAGSGADGPTEAVSVVATALAALAAASVAVPASVVRADLVSLQEERVRAVAITAAVVKEE